MTYLISLLAFVLAIGILVAFHEFGHFWVARKCGVKVLRFSIGFGAPLLKRTGKDGVEYVLAAIPLGGYVKMLDEREGPVPPHLLSQSFNQQRLRVRTAIVVAGPVFNFIFAILAYWLMFLIGIDGIAPLIGNVSEGSIAARYGLQPGMEVLEVEGKPTGTWQQVMNRVIAQLGDKELSLKLKKVDEHEPREVLLNLESFSLNKGQDPLAALGLEVMQPKLPPILGQVMDGDVAQKAGLMAQDRILEINDKKN
jgi:regulator of sigma E protease